MKIRCDHLFGREPVVHDLSNVDTRATPNVEEESAWAFLAEPQHITVNREPGNLEPMIDQNSGDGRTYIAVNKNSLGECESTDAWVRVNLFAKQLISASYTIFMHSLLN